VGGDPKMKSKVIISIVFSLFIGSIIIGNAVSGDKPAGQPFQALWDAIDYLQDQIISGDDDWEISSGDLYSIPSGNVGIGTETPHKKLEVFGDAMFTNSEETDPSSNTYFFIEQGRVSGVGTDGKRIGAWDEDEGLWKTLQVDGNPLLLNTRSLQSVSIGGYIQLALSTGVPPADDCDDEPEWGRMKVDPDDGSLYICTNSGWVTK
jgi:hypothetical protein